MIVALHPADSISLAVCCPRAGVRLRGRELRAADRAAAGRAWRLALEAAGLSPENSAGSRAHTEGAGAALVGPKGTVLGVDLVSPSRVTLRHAQAILDQGEWEALPVPLAIRGALGWGLKEAAAKALGNPARHFPAGLTVTCAENDVKVVARDEPHTRMVGQWQEIGSLLCVWVIKLPARLRISPEPGAHRHRGDHCEFRVNADIRWQSSTGHGRGQGFRASVT